MASIFEQTIVPKIKFSNFNLSETSILTCNFGQLVPCYLREVLPNDVFTMSIFADIQFAPMVAPMFQDVNCSIHMFYVPNRIVWDDFEVFITGAQEGHALAEDKLPTAAGVHPSWFAVYAQDMQGTIFDYLGLPNELSSTAFEDTDDVISDIPLRDYFKIWYDYYRDENLQFELNRDGGGKIDLFAMWRAWRASSSYLMDSPTDPTTGGFVIPNVWGDFSPFHRAYRKNYFTAALPTPQKGEPVTLNLGSTAPVTMDFERVRLQGESEGTGPRTQGPIFGFENQPNSDTYLVTEGGGPTILNETLIREDASPANFISYIQGRLINAYGNDPTLRGVADLSKASAITVEALREAFAVQEILESLSMRGSRYTEFLKGNFGVTPDDYKLQRPQFLGGVVTPVQVQQVLQNAGVDSTQGQMTAYAAGRAYAAAGDRVFRMRFKEHGYIMGILSVMPKDYYFQGIPRHFTRRDRFDYYLPQTAHLGEQAILNQELFFDGEDRDKNNAVFGYIPRWAEYKTATNSIHGDFRGSLNYYHMARIFGTTPTLSENFILTKDVQTRPFGIWKEARPNVNHLIWCNLFFKVTASRPMPYHSIPKVM